MKIIWVFMLLKADLLLVTGQDCTGTYGILPDLERRARNYVLADNEGYVSDALLESKWYKVNQNNIPTNYSNLDIGMCGTYFPIWMNGSVPSSSDGRVTRNACIISFFDVCSPVKTIEVVNCSTFMLYKLGPTVQSSGYCFDSIKSDSAPGQAPSYRPDSASVRPELYFTTERNPNGIQFRKPRLRFWCDFQESQKDKLFYSIAWYVNDVFFKQEDPELYISRDKTNLREDELIARNYKLDITIKCNVRASTSVNGFLGNRTVSPGYWMGVQVINPNVNVQQGKTAIVQLRATFPFGCYGTFKAKDTDCVMSVQMYDPYDTYSCTSSSISVKDSNLCGVRLPGLTYTDLLDGKNYTNDIKSMTITTKDVNDYNSGRNKFVLKLVTEGGNLVNDIIGGNYLPDINVVVQETLSWQGKVCYSHIDPHMRTFDEKYYENQNDGDFIMYRHRSNKQEVQMRTTRCWGGGATCACAVAVRAGGDLFMISICRTPRLISFVSCAESILQVTRMTPNLYKVFMPLGTVVDITIWNDVYLNIDIYPSVKDADETLGLCGVLNNNQGDDFKLPSGLQELDNNVFSTSWRIPSVNSFFSPMNFQPALWDEGSYLCVCPAALNTTPPTTASGEKLTPLCSASLYLSCTKKVINQGKPYACEVKTKRSETSRTKELERISIKQSTDADPVFDIHMIQKRQTRNYTFEEALALCLSIFDANCTTTAFEGSLPENSKTFKHGSLSNCALDIMYVGDTSLANVHCESYRSAVDEEISRNSTYREANPDVVSSFRSMACISSCNFHGDCINGTCFCHQTYVDEDCSVSLNVYPDVDDTFNGGLCKRDDEDCCGDKPIYGIHFVEGITKQKSERFQRFADGTETVLETISRNILVKNKYEGTMNIPCDSRERRSTDSRNINHTFVSGFRVYLTNDGKNYGSPQAYYIYDSRCQGVVNATDGYVFYLMNGTCFIDGVCYNNGNQDPSDSCKTCQSSVDPYSWTDGCSTNKRNPPSSPDNLILIVASVVASVVGLTMLVVSTIVIIKCWFQKERKISGNFEYNITSTSPANTTFHESAQNCAQTNVPDYEQQKEREPSFHNNKLLGNRPGSAKEISLEFNQTTHPY